MENIKIEITKPKEGWKQYGEVSALVSINGKFSRGGVFTKREFLERLEKDIDNLEDIKP